MQKIALICAIPQESRPILRRLSNPAGSYLKDIPVWICTSSNLQVFLAESGIGIKRAAEAAKEIIRFAKPDIVISTGFCGAVKPGLNRGDIVLAERVHAYTSTLLPTTVSIDKILLKILSSSGRLNFHTGTFITLEAMTAKCTIAARLDDRITNPVLEMESHAIAEVCSSNNVPFAGIRAVCDTADIDPQPVCGKIFDAEMKISMMKLLKSVMTEPMICKNLLQLYVDGEAAGRSLAHAVDSSLGQLQ